MRFSRRDFLKQAGAVGVAATAASVLPWLFRKLGVAEAAELTDYAAGSWTPSCCNMCGGQCGILAYVEDGKVRKIEPNGANPNNVANVSTNFDAARAAGDIGRLCAKGNAGMMSLYDPDRLRTPLKRVGPRGSGQFRAISWEEAVSEFALGLNSIKNRYGGQALQWFSEDHSLTHYQQDLCDALGSPNYSNHANLCDTSRKSHYLSSMGNDRPLSDMENTDLLFVWGWNFLSAIKWIHLASIFTRARMNNPNFRFMYVDPVYNETASKSDVWVAPKPGTDGALALAIAKLLIDAGTYDTTFVTNTTLGFAEYRKYLDGDGTYDAIPKTAAWAEGISGVPAAQITAIATELGAAYTAGRRICIDAWSGPGHHTNATQGGRAIDSLNILLGAIDKPGSLCMPLRNGPSRRSARPTWPPKNGWRIDGRDDVTIPATNADGSSNPVNGAVKKKYQYSHGSGIYVESRECMIEQRDFAGNPRPIKGAVFVFQNYVMSLPNAQRNIDSILAMEWVACIDTHLSETAMLADLVVPGSNYLERFDFNAFWGLFRVVGLRQQVVPSVIGGMSEGKFLLEVGAALGLEGFKTNPGVDDSDENYNKEEWDRFMATGNSGGPWANQMTWAQLKASSVWIETGAKGGTQYRKHELTGTFGATDTIGTIVAGTETVYTVRSSTGTVKGIATGPTMNVGDVYRVGFGTTSRRAQFWDPKLNACFIGTTRPAAVDVTGDNRYHPLPYFLDPEDAPNAQYPLYFISWKEVEHTHTRTHNNPWLMEMVSENRLQVHPTTAATYGIEEGDKVWVQTAHGQVATRAHLNAGLQPQTVGFVRGAGHWALGKVAMGVGAHDGWLLPGKAELHSGQAVHKEVACRIFKDR